jgi:predicted dehydrogenase
MKKVRFAVVGTGWISQVAFLPGTAQAPNCELAALVTGHPKKAEELAKKHNIPNIVSYKDYEKMLDGDVVDAVYIALPNHLHAKFAIAALKRGIHAIVEKPLAVTAAECTAMIKAAKAGKAKLMTAMRLHCEVGTLKFLDLIRDGAIGMPRTFQSPFSFSINADNHRLKAVTWGGPLQDLGVYCVNAARHVFGAEPTEVVAMAGRVPGDKRFREADENVSAMLRFPKDAIALFTSSFGAADQDSITVAGTKGTITLHGAYRFDYGRKITLTNGDGVKHIDIPHTDNFAGQSAYFADCILNKTKVLPDGEEGFADMRVLLAIEKATATGKSQKLPKSSRKIARLTGTLREFPPAK